MEHSEKLVFVQVLRALAAMSVTIAHTNGPIADTAIHLGQTSPLPGMVLGAAGVDLFFVISGFIMVYTTRGEWGSRGAAARFLSRRLVRIVPLYWLATFAFLAFVAHIGSNWPKESIDTTSLLSSLFFVFHARANGSFDPILGQGWSLNYEMVFYLAFAVAMLAPRRWLSIPVLLAVLFFVGGWRNALPFTLPTAVAYTLNPFLWEFVYGAAIALAYGDGRRIPRAAALALIAAGFAGLALQSAYPGLMPAVRALHWGLPCATILAGCVLLPYTWRGWAPVAFLGTISYSLYLFHGLLMMEARLDLTPVTDFVLLHGGAWVALVYFTAISVAGGAAIYLLVERPVTRGLRRLISQRFRLRVRAAFFATAVR